MQNAKRCQKHRNSFQTHQNASKSPCQGPCSCFTVSWPVSGAPQNRKRLWKRLRFEHAGDCWLCQAKDNSTIIYHKYANAASQPKSPNKGKKGTGRTQRKLDAGICALTIKHWRIFNSPFTSLKSTLFTKTTDSFRKTDRKGVSSVTSCASCLGCSRPIQTSTPQRRICWR